MADFKEYDPYDGMGLAKLVRAGEGTMLKTTVHHPPRFGTLSKTLIVYSVLGEYVHHPLTFLMGTALTFGRFKKRLPRDLPRDFADLFAYPAWIYMRLKEKLRQEEAFALARAIILPLGLGEQKVSE
jgi:hypothetical protein